MSLTLEDLWIPDGYRPVMKGPAERIMRHASLADLVEVLKQHGAEVREAHWTQYHTDPYAFRVAVTQSGRYLVLPLGDTPK